MSQLLKCTSCARHVRLSETACPFCATPLDVAERTASAQAVAATLPTRRLGRAALLALGLGVVAPVTSACSKDEHTTTDTPYGSEKAPDSGALPPSDASAAPAAMTGVLNVEHGDRDRFGQPLPRPPYGVPPHGDEDCDPPFTVDGRGRKKYKPKCLDQP